MALSIDPNGNSSLEVNVLRALQLGQRRFSSQTGLAAPALLMMAEPDLDLGRKYFLIFSSLEFRLTAEGCKNKSAGFD